MSELTAARDRTLAVILRYKDDFADVHLPDNVSARLRQIILEEVNRFYDAAQNLVDDAQPGYVLNELYFEKIQEIHAAVVPDAAD